MCIIYKPGPKLYTLDWQSCNSHKENKDKKIYGMKINMNANITSLNIPVCISIQDIQNPIHEDAHLQELKAYIIQGLPQKKEDVAQAIM